MAEKPYPVERRKDYIDMSVNIAVILNKLDTMEKEVSKINSKLESDFVTQDQFEPVKKIVYGLVSVVLLGVVGAVIALVIKK